METTWLFKTQVPRRKQSGTTPACSTGRVQTPCTEGIWTRTPRQLFFSQTSNVFFPITRSNVIQLGFKKTVSASKVLIVPACYGYKANFQTTAMDVTSISTRKDEVGRTEGMNSNIHKQPLMVNDNDDYENECDENSIFLCVSTMCGALCINSSP